MKKGLKQHKSNVYNQPKSFINRHIEYIKQKVDNEETYQAKVLDHNNLLERFRVQLVCLHHFLANLQRKVLIKISWNSSFLLSKL